MRRLIIPILLVIAVIWAFRWWDARPAAEPPAIVWARTPFRGPGVWAAPGEGVPMDRTLVAMSPEPLAEAAHAIPGQRILLRVQTSWVRGVAESLSWRKPFTAVDRMTASDIAAWCVRYYTFTGTTTAVGSQQWAEYRRDDPQPVTAR